jgi:hypothetical protein
MPECIRFAAAQVLVDELGHSVGDDAGKVERQIERASPEHVVLELMIGQAVANHGDIALYGVVGEETLALVVDCLPDGRPSPRRPSRPCGAR